MPKQWSFTSETFFYSQFNSGGLHRSSPSLVQLPIRLICNLLAPFCKEQCRREKLRTAWMDNIDTWNTWTNRTPPWKSQSEWQRTDSEINGENTSAKEQNSITWLGFSPQNTVNQTRYLCTCIQYSVRVLSNVCTQTTTNHAVIVRGYRMIQNRTDF